ncbi:MAG: branched-chain amino acid ABC transporter permease [Granulosicoccus sp.]
MTLLIMALVTGVALGSIYGLIALGFQITYSVSGTVNFAQGSVVMLGAVSGYMLFLKTGDFHWIAYPVAIVLCGLFGALVERFFVRPFASRANEGWLMATVAGGILLDNTVLFTFGNEPRTFPSSLVNDTIDVFGVGLYPLQIVIPVITLATAILLHLVFRYTKHGTALLAVVQNRNAAALMGINTQWMITSAFVLSGMLAGLAGLLIAPLASVHSEMGMLFGLKAFAVAILGGMTSASGIMVAGLIYGVVEAFTTTYFGSSFTAISVFGSLILILMIKPNGLFGQPSIYKV